MAKWDDRDPRWVVQHRDDGKNVNGWHWEDKNRFDWAKARLQEVLPALPPAQAGGLRVARVTDVAGEAMTSTRKGNKKLAIYDLKVTMKWEAQGDDDEQQYTGTLQLDDFASHSEPEEYVLTATADAVGDADKRQVYKAVAESLRPAIVEALQQLVQEMTRRRRAAERESGGPPLPALPAGVQAAVLAAAVAAHAEPDALDVHTGCSAAWLASLSLVCRAWRDELATSPALRRRARLEALRGLALRHDHAHHVVSAARSRAARLSAVPRRLALRFSDGSAVDLAVRRRGGAAGAADGLPATALVVAARADQLTGTGLGELLADLDALDRRHAASMALRVEPGVRGGDGRGASGGGATIASPAELAAAAAALLQRELADVVMEGDPAGGRLLFLPTAQGFRRRAPRPAAQLAHPSYPSFPAFLREHDLMPREADVADIASYVALLDDPLPLEEVLSVLSDVEGWASPAPAPGGAGGAPAACPQQQLQHRQQHQHQPPQRLQRQAAPRGGPAAAADAGSSSSSDSDEEFLPPAAAKPRASRPGVGRGGARAAPCGGGSSSSPHSRGAGVAKPRAKRAPSDAQRAAHKRFRQRRKTMMQALEAEVASKRTLLEELEREHEALGAKARALGGLVSTAGEHVALLQRLEQLNLERADRREEGGREEPAWRLPTSSQAMPSPRSAGGTVLPLSEATAAAAAPGLRPPPDGLASRGEGLAAALDLAPPRARRHSASAVPEAGSVESFAAKVQRLLARRVTGAHDEELPQLALHDERLRRAVSTLRVLSQAVVWELMQLVIVVQSEQALAATGPAAAPAPPSPALARLQHLQRAVTAEIRAFAVGNRLSFMALHLVNLETGSLGPPPQAHWARAAQLLRDRLAPGELSDLVAAWQLSQRAQQQMKLERAGLWAQLRTLLDTYEPAGYEHDGVILDLEGPHGRGEALLDAIDSNLRKEYTLEGIFQHSLHRLLSPLLSAEMLAHSYPYLPDHHAIMAQLAPSFTPLRELGGWPDGRAQPSPAAAGTAGAGAADGLPATALVVAARADQLTGTGLGELMADLDALDRRHAASMALRVEPGVRGGDGRGASGGGATIASPAELAAAAAALLQRELADVVMEGDPAGGRLLFLPTAQGFRRRAPRPAAQLAHPSYPSFPAFLREHDLMPREADVADIASYVALLDDPLPLEEVLSVLSDVEGLASPAPPPGGAGGAPAACPQQQLQHRHQHQHQPPQRLQRGGPAAAADAGSSSSSDSDEEFLPPAAAKPRASRPGVGRGGARAAPCGGGSSSPHKGAGVAKPRAKRAPSEAQRAAHKRFRQRRKTMMQALEAEVASKRTLLEELEREHEALGAKARALGGLVTAADEHVALLQRLEQLSLDSAARREEGAQEPAWRLPTPSQAMPSPRSAGGTVLPLSEATAAAAAPGLRPPPDGLASRGEGLAAALDLAPPRARRHSASAVPEAGSVESFAAKVQRLLALRVTRARDAELPWLALRNERLRRVVSTLHVLVQAIVREFMQLVIVVQSEQALAAAGPAAAPAPPSPALARLQHLQRAVTAEFRAFAVGNRLSMMALYLVNLETGSLGPPPPAHWASAAQLLRDRLAPGELSDLVAAWQLSQRAQQQMKLERAGLWAQLRTLLDTYEPAGYEHDGVILDLEGPHGRGEALLDAIDSNLRKEYTLGGIFNWAIHRLLSPLLSAEMLAHSYPYLPDHHAIMAQLAPSFAPLREPGGGLDGQAQPSPAAAGTARA
ncbi:AHSA2 [Scenedesmus sp. PABB004]|nr:AHSA2 [Scenedesmus sp. PABB004]